MKLLFYACQPCHHQGKGLCASTIGTGVVTRVTTVLVLYYELQWQKLNGWGKEDGFLSAKLNVPREGTGFWCAVCMPSTFLRVLGGHVGTTYSCETWSAVNINLKLAYKQYLDWSTAGESHLGLMNHAISCQEANTFVEGVLLMTRSLCCAYSLLHCAVDAGNVSMLN